mmetsp:Transcript_27335/g.52029  ORF Transcript_27335/g.52029 Transcript_27335/m.52029 type:complete len:358 (-) Transcript_27335:262-1335(-)
MEGEDHKLLPEAIEGVLSSPEPLNTKREICPRCSRPTHNSCLCSSLPATPACTAGGVFILQHPHERKRNLATAPILQKCLRRCWVVRSRRFDSAKNPLVNALLVRSTESPALPIVLLYPGPGAVGLQDLAQDQRFQEAVLTRKMARAGLGKPNDSCEGGDAGGVRLDNLHDSNNKIDNGDHIDLNNSVESPVDHRGAAAAEAEAERLLGCDYVVLVLDGTWQQAREMFASSFAALPFSCSMARLDSPDTDSSAAPEQARMRSEPSTGCMLTIEAVSEALRLLEGKDRGPAVADVLLAPLQLITKMQARWDPALKPGYKPDKRERVKSVVPKRQRAARMWHPAEGRPRSTPDVSSMHA